MLVTVLSVNIARGRARGLHHDLMETIFCRNPTAGHAGVTLTPHGLKLKSSDGLRCAVRFAIDSEQ